MTSSSEAELIRKLEAIDTPTISNVVATYPTAPAKFAELCLKLYDPWYGEWYTDASIHCMFPEFGARVGYAATVVFSEKSEKYVGKDVWALPEHLDSTKKPVVLVARQDFPPAFAARVGLFGGNMTTQYKALGVVGVVTDGPIRDLDEIRETGVQYLATGLCPAHGDMMVRAVGVPVTVGGMTVVPGDVVHMDKHGAVKFPASKIQQVLDNVKRLEEREAAGRKIFHEPGFSLAKWKSSGR